MKIHQVGDLIGIESDNSRSFIIKGREVNIWDVLDKIFVTRGSTRFIYDDDQTISRKTTFKNIIIDKDTELDLNIVHAFEITSSPYNNECCLWAHWGHKMVAEIYFDKVHTKAGVTLSDGQDIMELLFA
jgi:hypothetical protein